MNKLSDSSSLNCTWLGKIQNNLKDEKILNISLITLQIVGVLLLAVSVPGTAQLIAMNLTTIKYLVVSGSVIVITSSFVWARTFPNQNPMVRKTFYAITALAIVTMTLGGLAATSVFSGGILAGRCVFAAGGIMILPTIFPNFLALMKGFEDCIDNSTCLKKKKITQ